MNETAWTFRGEPVAQIYEDEDDPDRILDFPEWVARTEIPVERCSGRVLLLSGDDDQVWSSTRLSEIARQRALRCGAGDRVEHVCTGRRSCRRCAARLSRARGRRGRVGRFLLLSAAAERGPGRPARRVAAVDRPGPGVISARAW